MVDTPPTPLSDEDMAALERLLDAVPAPLESLDLMMLDGFLVGVLLQPKPVPEAQWFGWVLDVDNRPAPARYNPEPLRALVRRRHAELNRAIHTRQWFDPWVFELDDEAEDPLQAIMPWVAGFAIAMDAFPALMDHPSPDTQEPLATLYRVFDPDDLEDADALLALMDTLEPPADLAEAVESLVSSTLLLADVSRPQHQAPTAPPRSRRTAPRAAPRPAPPSAPRSAPQPTSAAPARPAPARPAPAHPASAPRQPAPAPRAAPATTKPQPGKPAKPGPKR